MVRSQARFLNPPWKVFTSGLAVSTDSQAVLDGEDLVHSVLVQEDLVGSILKLDCLARHLGGSLLHLTIDLDLSGVSSGSSSALDHLQLIHVAVNDHPDDPM